MKFYCFSYEKCLHHISDEHDIVWFSCRWFWLRDTKPHGDGMSISFLVFYLCWVSYEILLIFQICNLFSYEMCIVELLRDEQHTDSKWFFIWNMWFKIWPCVGTGWVDGGVRRDWGVFPHGWYLWFFIVHVGGWWNWFLGDWGKYYLYHNKLTYINLW